MKPRTKLTIRAANEPRRPDQLSILKLMTPAESRRAQAIAYEAALAVIG